ncbi:hypothetical protein DFQ27_009461, partial [Actinomortierella ambigua]
MEQIKMTNINLADLTDFVPLVLNLQRNNQQSRGERVRALQLQLGVMLSPDTFACKLACHEDVCITFVDGRRKIRIQFKRKYGDDVVDHQMELKVQDLGIGCITVDDDYHNHHKGNNNGNTQSTNHNNTHNNNSNNSNI